MVLVLLLSLTAPAPAGAAAAVVRNDPPVKVWLNQDNHFQRGDKAHVNVKLGEDGYLVVLAARSVTPFKFDELVRGDHWDYRVLTARDAGDDKEQALHDIVQRMVPDGHFDYDVVSYTVASPRAYYDGSYYRYSSSVGLHLGYGYGWPRSLSFSLAFGDPFFVRPLFFRARCFDPFFVDPFFCNPFFFDPFFFHRRLFFPQVVVFSRTVIVLRGRVAIIGIPVRRRLLIDRARPGFRGRFLFTDPTLSAASGPRLRVPTGALLQRTPPSNAAGRRGELMGRHAATPIRERRPSLEPRLPAPRIENRPQGTAQEAPARISDRRQMTVERRMPGPAARPQDRVTVPPAWRAPDRLHEPGFSGWWRTPTTRNREFSAATVSGRTFALPSRPAGSLHRGGGRRR